MNLTTIKIDSLKGEGPLGQKEKESVTFYNTPPTSELSLDDFERFAFDRLVMLREIEKESMKLSAEDELKPKINLVHYIFISRYWINF
jgi:ribosomal protein S10